MTTSRKDNSPNRSTSNIVSNETTSGSEMINLPTNLTGPFLDGGEPLRHTPLSLGTPERAALVGVAKEARRVRRTRRRYFPDEMFGEAAWDILLTLYVAAENRSINISAAGEASGVPLTTALRWIAWLEQTGLIERRKHHFDARISFVLLTDVGSIKMDQCLQAMLRIRS